MTRRRTGSGSKDEQQRRLIIHEAARLMAEGGFRDFGAAKRKAAERLGITGLRNLPGNEEIEQELMTYQRLFRSAQPHALRQLREAAAQAMRLLAEFRPRLVGPVLSGTADQNSPVHLHLFADTPEQVALFLMQKHIPYEDHERVLRVTADRREKYPVFRFIAGDLPVELTVFPQKGIRQSPLSPVDGKPMARADLEAVVGLLESEPNLDL